MTRIVWLWCCVGCSATTPLLPGSSGTESPPEVAAANPEPPAMLQETPAPGTPPAPQPEPAPPAPAASSYVSLRHSRITAADVARFSSIIGASRDRHRFMRIGDNLSHPYHLLGCAASDAAMDTGTEDFSVVLSWFRNATVNPFSYHPSFISGAPVENDVFENLSVSDTDGVDVVVDAILAAMNPAYALVMFGTLELGWAGSGEANRTDDPKIVERTGPAMLHLLDRLIAKGTLPLVRTIPPARPGVDNPIYDRVRLVNGIIRATSALRGVPLLDLFDATQDLPKTAFWDDGFHLESAPSGTCDFATGLDYADNVMSHEVLRQLQRVHGALTGTAPDVASPLTGAGTAGDPFVVEGVPFADAREGGGVYTLTVTEKTKVRVLTPASGGAVAHQGGSTHAWLLELELQPGTHVFSVTGTGPRAIAIEPCFVGDATCVGN